GPSQSAKDLPKPAPEQLQKHYGLDRPLGVQYLSYLSHAARLDFGPSYKFPTRSVREIIFEAFPVSLELGAWALLLSVLIGVPIGVIAALKQNTGVDAAVMGLALAGVSIPNFVLGPSLVLGLSLTLFMFPPALWQGPQSRVLPVLTLSTAYIAYIARLTRAGMLEVLRQDFIRTAFAKGLSDRVVIFKHALKLGILPVVSYIGPATARVIMGSIVVETIFAIPGLGRDRARGDVVARDPRALAPGARRSRRAGPRARRHAALAGPLVRHGRARPRHVRAHALRRSHLAPRGRGGNAGEPRDRRHLR